MINMIHKFKEQAIIYMTNTIVLISILTFLIKILYTQRYYQV